MFTITDTKKNYLTNKCQRTKLNTGFSKWTEILLGVPRGSVLGPFLFNIFMKKLILIAETTNGCNYALCKRHNILCM